MDTKDLIINKVYHDMQVNGFQGLRADKVVTELGITKGAFYHYFKSKHEIAYAVIIHIIKPQWLKPFQEIQSELNKKENVTLIKLLHQFLDKQIKLASEDVNFSGCPFNNLVQEMGSRDEFFRVELKKIYDEALNILSSSIKLDQKRGNIKKDLHANNEVLFFLSSLEGATIHLKINKDLQSYKSTLKVLKEYIKTWN